MDFILRRKWDAQVNVQGIANSVAEMLAKSIGEQAPALLVILQKEMRTIRKMIIGNRTHPKKILDELENIRKYIIASQHWGIQNARKKMSEEAAEFATVIAKHEAHLLQVLLDEQNSRDVCINNLPDKTIRDMIAYKQFVDGRTIWQWFDKLEYDNANTIFNAVQKGVVDGMTLNSIMQVIQGRQTPHGWEPGILDRNRRSAEMLARTVINATANQSRLEMYQANADVLDGVQWRAALDHRTCLICGAYDGKIWSPDKMHEVKVPPAHPNCRCRLVPYIDIGEGVGRPAEAENFDQMAKEKYEAKYKGKKYDDLSYDYRRKLRYDAIKEYQKNGGEPYKRVESSTTFADYLKGQSDEFQREWLGPGKYKLYKDGKLPLEYMVKPDTGFKRTVEDLEREFGTDTVSMFPASNLATTFPASKEGSIVNYEWEKNPLVQQELAKNKACNESYDLQLQALEARVAAAREEMKTKFPYMVERTGAIKDWTNAKREDKDKVETILSKMYDIDRDKRRLEKSILSDVDIKRQNEAIIQALFPKLATTNLSDTEKRIMDKFTMLTTVEQKDALDKMLRLSKTFGVDLDQFARNVHVNMARANQGIGFIGTKKNIDGTRKLVSVNFQNDVSPNIVAHEFGHIIEIVAHSEIHEQYKDLTKGKANKKITKFSGLKHASHNDQGSYKDLPFSYPQSSVAAQYLAKTYNTGETELISVFFEHLFTDARSLLTKHPDYVRMILAVLEE